MTTIPDSVAASGGRTHIVLVPGFAGFDALGQIDGLRTELTDAQAQADGLRGDLRRETERADAVDRSAA